ncbi:MAG: hypothetical protein L3J08_05760 [Flavobacteriaceae bacterium]|nr:hypothetical protein [Flavobacteriaceae bacterium]
MYKRWIYILFFLFFAQVISAQCAMCRAVVEQGGEEAAEGINSGIIYLMIFPYLIIGAAIFFLYRSWKKRSQTK